MTKHFRKILVLIYQTFQRWFDYYVYRFFAQAHVSHATGKIACILDQIQK